MRLSNFLLLMPLLLFLACGKSSDKGLGKTVTLSTNQIDEVLSNQDFECASLGGRCPGGIARIFVVDASDPSLTELCTGFMVSPTRLVTNHHCLSQHQQCENTYVSVYNGDSYETTRCKRLVRAEDDGRSLDYKVIDFAVVELEDAVTSSSPFPLSNSPLHRGSRLTAWVIDHVDLFKGRITELNCEYLGINYSLELGNCPAISGNSGSPVVNDGGQIVGVLWGSTTDESVSEETPLAVRREIDDYAYVTSLKYFRSALNEQ